MDKSVQNRLIELLIRLQDDNLTSEEIAELTLLLGSDKHHLLALKHLALTNRLTSRQIQWDRINKSDHLSLSSDV